MSRAPLPLEYPLDATDIEKIAYEHKHAVAIIHLLEVETGWMSAPNYSHHTGNHQGMHCPLSHSDVFPSRAAALKAASDRIAAAQDHLLSEPHDSLFSSDQRKQCRAILEWCFDIQHQLL